MLSVSAKNPSCSLVLFKLISVFLLCNGQVLIPIFILNEQ